MPNQKIILRREHFGGILVDTTSKKNVFLNHQEYEAKKLELLHRDSGVPIKIFDSTERGYQLLQDALSSPTDMYFELTKECDNSCKHCFADASPKSSKAEMSFSDIESIIRKFSDIGGIYGRLSGGEPTKRSDFFKILDVINEERLIAGLNTNGMYGREKVDEILSRNVKDIRISLDGPEKVNDSIRGEGTYSRIIKTLERLAEYNSSADCPADVTINTVLMKSNKDYIGEMIEIGHAYGFKNSFGLLRPSGRGKTEEMLSPEDIVRSAYKVQEARKVLGLQKGKVKIDYDIFCEGGAPSKFPPFPFGRSRCNMSTQGVGFDSQGRILPCNYLVNVENGRWLGEDARGKDLLKLWHESSVLKESRQARREGCSDCEYHVVKCNGGCPVMAYIFEGDIDGKDPYCVRNVDINGAVNKK
jgi:radical SAM protein with 4Fe4S-binding SPASM domain